MGLRNINIYCSLGDHMHRLKRFPHFLDLVNLRVFVTFTVRISLTFVWQVGDHHSLQCRFVALFRS